MVDKYATTRYNRAPQVKHPRTRFDLSHEILTTFNNGEFVPILVEHINPGETVDLNYSSLTRLETSVHQTMDNAYIEFAYFFVPLRILWTDFEKFEGANDDPWTQTTTYTIPQILLTGATGSDTVSPGSLLNHLMLPAGTYGSGSSNKHLSVEALSLRGVYEVYNQWYRDQNYDSIIYFGKQSADIYISNLQLFNGSYFGPKNSMLKVNRLRDRFSTALPSPQKGQEVFIPITGYGDVLASTTLHDMGSPLRLAHGDETGSTIGYPLMANVGSSNNGEVHKGSSTTAATGDTITHSNLVANLSAANVTINQLRLAIVRQAMMERDARSGTRYTEILASRWDCQTNDLVLDRPEFLGGKRIPISMMEVLQTSESGVTYLGTNAGVSKTIDKSDGFIKSFTQHGILLGFMYTRTERSYSQGIDRKHFIKDYLDMPDPMLDNTGETAVWTKEMYALGTTSDAGVAAVEAAVGYQEQYYWLKEHTNRFSGYFQPGISGTLASWHFGDNYSGVPFVSAAWLKEGPENVDRTIAIDSETAGFQFLANVYFDLKITRPFRKYSIPNTFGF